MYKYKRHGLKWTTKEVLQLEREVDLLQLSVDEIADLHGRSPRAIDFKIMQEKELQDDNISRLNKHVMITRSDLFNIF